MDYKKCPYCAERLNFESLSRSELCPHCSKKFPEDFRKEALRYFRKERIETISRFGLTIEETRIMISYQYCLTLSDIDNETNEEKKKIKKQWLEKFKNSLDHSNGRKTTGSDFNDFIITTKYPLLKKEAQNLITPTIDSERSRYLILMEITFFTPYYPLYTKKYESKNKPFKKLRFNHKKARSTLGDYADSLGIDKDKNYIDLFLSARKNVFNGITDQAIKMLLGGLTFAILIAISGGLAAPAIGVLFAPAGLHGAAAVSAGLAALGGGAIAAGGLGMAGGTAVIIGGGAILGGSMGAGIGSIISASPNLTLLLAVKLEVAIRIIALKTQNDIQFAQDILESLENKIDNSDEELQQAKGKLENLKKQRVDLKNNLSKLKNESDKNKEKIKSIENDLSNIEKMIKGETKENNNSNKSLGYLKKILKRNKAYVAKYNKKE